MSKLKFCIVNECYVMNKKLYKKCNIYLLHISILTRQIIQLAYNFYAKSAYN